MNKRLTKWLSWLLVFALMMVNMPVTKLVWAEDTPNEVRVIIKNDTFTKANGAKWDGTLIDTTVALSQSSNAVTVVEEAVKEAGYTITGAESNYITEIGGLSAYDGGSMSGWMGTLNDWFTVTGLEEYSVANGSLQAGDEICMWYSCAWGADIGSDWMGTSTSLKNITFSSGTLTKGFASETTEYTLVIPDDVKEVQVTPTAENKNFMVKTYKNAYTPAMEGTEYKRSENIPVVSGDKIIVGVGNTNWPSMNSGQTETVYTFHVKYASENVIKPVFEQFDFMSSYLNGWTSGETYQQDKLSYDVEIKNYNTSSVVLQSTTKYDTEKYIAVAKYVDSTGEDRCVTINSEKLTTLSNMNFGVNTVEVVIYEKANEGNSTTYTFHVTRPYDTTIGLNTSKGFTVVPEGRSLLSTLYMNKGEGTIFQLDENGEVTSAGMSASCQNYKAFVLDGLQSFRIMLTGKTNYVRIRISDDGVNYTEVTSGNTSPVYQFEEEKEKKLFVQTISDSEYLENGFRNVETLGNAYTLTVVSVDADVENAKMMCAESDGEWYPEFDKDIFSYGIIIENSADLPTLTFKVAEDAKVVLGTNELNPDAEGNYQVELKTSAQQIKVQAENGIVNTYSFKAVKKSKNDIPDKVVDYLCINSQYTNTNYGIEPFTTLSGSMKSLGNFGGYITYYYEDAIMDNPNNKYGVDFYVYGNSFAQGGSAAESGQVWVSEDGLQWYALAGSEHYEDTTLKDYEITYTKTDAGKTAWTDNYGGSNDGLMKSGAWVQASNYYLNDLAKSDTITLRGILLPCIDGTLYGNGSTASFVAASKFGYVDYNTNGTIGADINPYDEAAKSNGFDLKWAVDDEGNPVTLKNGVHYVKIVTATNIWAGAFGEKSTEVSTMVRTTATEDNVGTTATPESIVITNENNEETIVEIKDNIQTYDVLLDDSKNVKLSVQGADESDNIYVNNTRIVSTDSADISVGDTGKKVRVIIQNGEKEPVIFILNMVSESIGKTQNIFEETTEYFLNGNTPIVDSIGGEWRVIGLARAERISETFRLGYFKNAYEYVQEVGSAKLHNTKSTDNARMILALTSLGYDVTDVAGHNLLTPLNNLDYVKKQGINGLIWTLIALDSGNYEIPEITEEGTQVTRENLIQAILDKQLENGGFALDDENSDTDMTAMALQALAPYYSSDVLSAEQMESLINTVEKAVTYLSETQNEDGSYGSISGNNCESTAQVVVALSSLGINPRTDARFVKNGTSVLSALLSYYNGNGQFLHEVNGQVNEMATEQAYLALVSYNRLISEKEAIYVMRDVTIGENPVITDESEHDNNDNNNNNNDDNQQNNQSEDVNPDNSSNNQNNAPDNNKEQQADNTLPQTGDKLNVLLYVLLLSGSAMGIYITVRHKKRKISE